MKHAWIPVLLIAFALAGVLMFPLRVAWMMTPAISGLGVQDIGGTVWNGRAAGVTWRGIELGDFAVSLSPLDLLPSPKISIAQGTGLLTSASVRAAGSTLAVTDVILALPLATLDGRLPETAIVRLKNGAIDLDQSDCLRASGQVVVDDAGQTGLGALTGELSCDRDHIIVTLSSPAGGQAVLAARLDGAGGAFIREASPELALILAGIGLGASDRPSP